MVSRCRFGAIALLGLILGGCSDEPLFKKVPLNKEQSQHALRKLRITIPDSYAFVSMTESPPPFTGGASYDGIYDSPAPPAPVQVDGVPVPMSPTTCQQLGLYLPDGIHCASASNLQLGSTNLSAGPDVLTVLSATLPSGKSRVYVTESGH